MDKFDYRNNGIVKDAVYAIISKQHLIVSELARGDYSREIAKMKLDDFMQGIDGVLVIDEMDSVLKTLEKFGASKTDFRFVTGVYGDLKDYSKFTANLMARLDDIL